MLRDDLEQRDGLENFLKEIKEVCINSKEIIIFGAGIGGQKAYNFLKEIEMIKKIKGFSDNNIRKIGSYYNGFPVYDPTSIYNMFKDAIVLVASTAFSQIKIELLSYGYTNEKIFYFQLAGLVSEEGDDAEFIWKHISDFEQAYEWLEDDKSKEIFKNILNYKISKKEKYLIELKNKYVDSESTQYFDKFLINYEKLVSFVDVGSFTGDTIKALYTFLGKEQLKCYCFEADSEIFKILKKEIELNNWENVETFNYGVWNKKDKLYFDTKSGQNGGSRISENGDTVVQVESLDNLLRNKEISFIKMDIEGAELRALKGTVKIVREQMPILAICVYHTRADFFKIPQFIKEINPEYKLYFRQYRYGQSETVCYALPKEN